MYWNIHSRSSRLAGVRRRVFSIIPVGNQIDAPMPCQGGRTGISLTLSWLWREEGCAGWIADKTGKGRSRGGGQAVMRSRPASQGGGPGAAGESFAGQQDAAAD